MKVILGILAAASAIAVAQPASAATYLITPTTTNGGPSGQAYFTVNYGNPFTGKSVVHARFGDLILSGTPSNLFAFSDDYQFHIGPGVNGTLFIGFGSGTVSTSSGTAGVDTDLDFTSVFLNNGVTNYKIKITSQDGGLTEVAQAGGIPIYSGETIDLIISGVSRGSGQFDGNLTFKPAVPEASTWMMMLLGFGFLGMAFRRRPRRSVQVA